MSAALATSSDLQVSSFSGTTRFTRPAARAENVLASLALGTMVVLPLAEAALRRTLHVSIPASISIVHHMVLIVGMLGGVIAAREKRLLCLSNFAESKLHRRAKNIAGVITAAVSAVICGYLSLAAFQFALTERDAAKMLVWGIPVWLVECVLPLGFAIIALRILWQTSEKWSARAAALALTFLFAILAWQWPATGHHFVPLALTILFFASILGVPALVTLGGAALILFWGVGQPIASIPIAHYALVTNPTLPTLPLFTLAGYFLAESGAPRRLIRVFYALFGRFRGGPAIVTVLVCAFFTSFTGASGVTILALGGLLMPVLAGAKYSEKDSLGLMTGAG